MGDFDRDGKLDLALGGFGSDGANVAVALGNGDGTFRTTLGFASEVVPTSFVVGDFDGDGRIDLATISPSGATLLFGSGDGTFKDEVQYVVGRSPLSAELVRRTP